jgi:hypothetical protein
LGRAGILRAALKNPDPHATLAKRGRCWSF